MILIVDNHDSFTYNILDTIKKISTQEIISIKSSTLDIEQIEPFDKIILSPGPMLPSDYPILFQILKKYQNTKSILGICLGHQAICQFYGAELYNLQEVKHGYPSQIKCDPSSILFKGISSTTVGRYHSWAAKNIPKNTLKITASTEDGCIMGVEHPSKNIFGIQFHPESYISSDGATILKNFIDATNK